MANEPKRIKHILECLADPHVELNDWEQEFFADVETRFKKYGSLSDGTYNHLEKIWERRAQ